MGGRTTDDPGRAALVFAPGHPDGADLARRVPPGVPADRRPDWLHHRPARPDAARAGPHPSEPPSRDLGGPTTTVWHRARAPAGGQHGAEAVRGGRVAGRARRHEKTSGLAETAPPPGCRYPP